MRIIDDCSCNTSQIRPILSIHLAWPVRNDYAHVSLGCTLPARLPISVCMLLLNNIYIYYNHPFKEATDGWVFGSNNTGATGWFPMLYLDFMDDG